MADPSTPSSQLIQACMHSLQTLCTDRVPSRPSLPPSSCMPLGLTPCAHSGNLAARGQVASERYPYCQGHSGSVFAGPR